MYLKRILLSVICIAAGVAVTGCQNTKDMIVEYNPLKSTKPEMSQPVQVNIQPQWASKTGRGAGGFHYEYAPVIVEDVIYTVDRKGAFAKFDKATGKLIWRYATRMKVTSNLNVDDRFAYAANDKGEVFAMELANGQITWKTPLKAEVIAQPQVAEDKLVVSTLKGGISVLDKATGDSVWAYEVASPMMIVRRANAPLVVGNVVYAGLANGKILAFELDTGEIMWERKVGVPHGIGEIGNLIDIDTQPVLADGKVLVKTYQDEVVALNAATGSVVWQREGISATGFVVQGDRVFVVGREGGVWALAVADGKTLWESPTVEGRILAPPVLMQDHIVVGDSRGYLLWMAKQDGHLSGYHRFARRAIKTSPIVEDDTLYVMNAYGKLGAYQMSPLVG